MSELLYKELSYKICGLLFETHNNLGRYKNEKQYADYLEGLFKKEAIEYKREYKLPQAFKEEKEGRNICDFIIEGKMVLELKTKTFLDKDDYFQVKRYLSSSNLQLGILVNFRRKYITPKRILNNKNKLVD